MNRYVCIHGHFYQPPRENPWLERVELQDSAAPFHDWNERITEECYSPNARSRLLDSNGKVRDIVSNYSRMSFNFGPTLLTWMEKHSPQTHAAIIEANNLSKQRFGGHASALAQVYNHMILPLANRRDKRTQVLWGIRDYEKRFGSFPEGMWLAETAADFETLDVLAECGIKFTILSQYQAARLRKDQYSPWQDAVGGKIDPTQPYLHRLASGRQITIFFYDGPISRALAFEGLLKDGRNFANRIVGAFVDSRKHSQLVSIATDGESYGHHHQFGEMALSYALDFITTNKLALLTNYGQYLEMFPPKQEVEIIEKTAWSCSHGVDRWRANCGCNSGGHSGWNQEWRGPLRDAFDWLRNAITPAYETKMKNLGLDPWEVRDDYINIILDRSGETVDRFFAQRTSRALSHSEKSFTLKLLEMQRNALLMYTSCGWFFDELSGIETVQCMQYAGRVVQLARDAFDMNLHLEEEFCKHLAKSRSNLTEYGNGHNIYQRHVKPAVIDFLKVAAHYAVSTLFEHDTEEVNLYSFVVKPECMERNIAGKATLTLGRAQIMCQTTLETANITFGALNFGDHNINAGVRYFVCGAVYDDLVREATEAFEKMDMTGVIRVLDRHFVDSTYSLKSLFRDEQRRIMDKLLAGTESDLNTIYEKTYHDHYTLMRFLVDMGAGLPRTFSSVTTFVVDLRLRELLKAPKLNLDELKDLLEDAKRWGFELKQREYAHIFGGRAESLMAEYAARPHSVDELALLEEFIQIIKTLPLRVNLWRVQNEFFTLSRDVFPRFAKECPKEKRDSDPWFVLFQSLGEHLSISLPEIT